jgi:uncharacterized protein YrzB (UPF0473 family)
MLLGVPLMSDITEFNEGVDIIETTDEDGKVHIFERVEEIEVDGNAYALLVYQGSEDEKPPEGYDEEIVVMKISKDPDGTDVFEQIEDEAEFERVLNYIESLDMDDIEVVASDEDDAEGANK